MRKLTKTAAVVASMAVMAMGTTVLAGAATEGWVQSGSNWYYYVDGNKVSEQWVLAGENWYFVDEEGRMVKNTFVRFDKYDKSSEVLDDSDIHASLGRDDIDDDSEFYYMNADGTMHTGWKEFKASNIYASPNSDKASTLWYYFGASGRMYVNEWVESNGEWYALSDNGQMYVEAVVNNDLIEWDDGNFYYMDKNGAWVKGWYKTTNIEAGSAPLVTSEDESTNQVFMQSKDKWVYGDPETGVLAYKEWKDINGKYYFFGHAADTDIKKDENLFLETVLIYKGSDTDGTNSDGKYDALTSGNIDINKGFVVTGGATNPLDERTPKTASINDIVFDAGSIINQANTAEKKAAMYSDVFVRWRNHKGWQEYFYLKKDDGDALTTWKELEDDYWICGNDKGELYYDEVALVKGKYYYFDKGGICDEKSLNNTVDYVAIVDPESTEEKDHDDSYHISSGAEYMYLYETTSTNNKNMYDATYGTGNLGDYTYLSNKTISQMKEALATYKYTPSGSSNEKEVIDLAKVYYRINNRKVNVKSMTDQEVILAYTATYYSLSDTAENSNHDRGYKKDITIYKLRTSAKLSGKVEFYESDLPESGAKLVNSKFGLSD